MNNLFKKIFEVDIEKGAKYYTKSYQNSKYENIMAKISIVRMGHYYVLYVTLYSNIFYDKNTNKKLKNRSQYVIDVLKETPFKDILNFNNVEERRQFANEEINNVYIKIKNKYVKYFRDYSIKEFYFHKFF